MSFSTNVKEELSKISNLANKKLVKAEIIGYLITSNAEIKNKKLEYSTENEYNINRFAKLLNNIEEQNYNIELQGKSFVIISKIPSKLSEISVNNSVLHLNEKIKLFLKSDLDEKALIRGCFLGSGSINNPQRVYHLEISINTYDDANCVKEILKKYDIDMKILKKDKNYSIYLKDGEQISNFLALIGANSSVLKFEEIRVLRDMRNNVNRIVNCETANLNKTINASLKQVEDIKLIKKKNKFNELSENLQEIAKIRLENPDATLIEIGKMLKKPLGKSGVNHRFQAISKISEELK